jgi:hypothetical protein
VQPLDLTSSTMRGVPRAAGTLGYRRGDPQSRRLRGPRSRTEEQRLPPSGDGTVVLDIGGDIGALVVRAPAELDGVELDLFPAGCGVACMHSAVRRRDVLGGSLFAAVYPCVPAGEYTLAGLQGPVRIDGGAVTELAYATEPI